MAGKNKLQRFAENETFNHLFQYGFEQLNSQEFPLKGKWNESFFKNDNPIVVELGCGKGDYTVGLARIKPDHNFIGIDIKGSRMWIGLKASLEEGLKNVAFIRTKIELSNQFFAENEVSEIWITFPDPQPQLSRIRKRLTSQNFLDRYRNFLKKDGIIHLKTDSSLLYDYTLELLQTENYPIHYHTDNLYETLEAMEVKQIKTFYEEIWLSQGLSIKYIRFGLDK